MRQEGLIPRYRQDRENTSRAIIQRELGSEENSSRYFAVRHEDVCVCIFAKQRMKKKKCNCDGERELGRAKGQKELKSTGWKHACESVALFPSIDSAI